MADEDDPVGIDKTFRALQRTGPTLMLLASEIGAAGRGRAGDTGAFYIDPERAQECIATLERVALDLEDAKRLADEAARVDPPATDLISGNLADQTTKMAGQARTFVDTWQSQVRECVAVLQDQLSAYSRVESTIAGKLP